MEFCIPCDYSLFGGLLQNNVRKLYRGLENEFPLGCVSCQRLGLLFWACAYDTTIDTVAKGVEELENLFVCVGKPCWCEGLINDESCPREGNCHQNRGK